MIRHLPHPVKIAPSRRARNAAKLARRPAMLRSREALMHELDEAGLALDANAPVAGTTVVARVGIVGGGQLARITAMPALKPGCDVVVLERHAASPAAQVAMRTIIGDWNDPDVLLELEAIVTRGRRGEMATYPAVETVAIGAGWNAGFLAVQILAATAVKSNIRMPEPVHAALTIYLPTAIGSTGGVAIAAAPALSAHSGSVSADQHLPIPKPCLRFSR